MHDDIVDPGGDGSDQADLVDVLRLAYKPLSAPAFAADQIVDLRARVAELEAENEELHDDCVMLLKALAAKRALADQLAEGLRGERELLSEEGVALTSQSSVALAAYEKDCQERDV